MIVCVKCSLLLVEHIIPTALEYDHYTQEVTAQAARLRGEAERAGRDRAGMEEVYTSLKKGVEGEAEAIKARFDDLQARVIEADARRDQVK